MSKFSLEWFKSKKAKKLINLLIEEQSMINESIKKKAEKPYKKLKLVNDVLTVVLNNGDVISKPSCSVHEFQRVSNSTSELEVLQVFDAVKEYDERQKEILHHQKMQTVRDNFDVLKQLNDFEIDGTSVKLKGINRTMPQLLVEKFIEVASRQLSDVDEDLQTVCNQDVEYVALKRFFMWCCLNPRAEVADKLYDFLMKNSFKITKQGFFVALRNVVTLHGSNELVKFVSESYTKIKAVWKKSPDNYHVILEEDGEYSLIHKNDMFTTVTEQCDDCNGTGNVWNEDEEDVTCYVCDGEGEVRYNEKNYEGKDLGVLTELYLDLPNRTENRFTDDWTKTFDIRIGRVVSMPMEEANWSTQDCAAAGLHFTSDEINYVGCGDQSVLMLINPMRVVGIGEKKGRCYEYLPISTVSRDESTKILHDLDFDTIDLDEFYLENELESLTEKAQKSFAIETEKHEFNLPSISSSEIGNIVSALNRMKDELGSRVQEIV
jgi:hypothetical protein